MVTKTKETPLLSERVREEREELLSAPPQIDTERLRLLLEVYGATDGEPTVMRRAKLFARLCSEKTIFIDGNPLVGTLTKYKYGGYPMPEVACRWMERAERFSLQRGQASLTAEDREWIDKAIARWKDANVFNRTREIVLQSLGVDIAVLAKCGLATELTPGGFIDPIVDYSKVLNQGLSGVIAEIEEARARVDIGGAEGLGQWYFYGATLLCLKGMIALAQRYAIRAREMAEGQEQPERKRELEAIAEACAWVPARPPRSFYEALQSLWFTMLGVWLESATVLLSPPSRFTQYMYPFFKKDKEQGRLTDEEAIELLQFFFLKVNGLAQVLPPHGFAWSQSRLGQHLVLGGLTADGRDATNELDWLVLEAQRRIRLPEPLVDLVYHDRLSEEFLLKCVELIRTGIGQPAFHNVQKAIERHLYHDKMPLEEARNISIVGCVQSNIPGYSALPWEAMFNVAKMVELALNDGKDPLTGTQLGPQTGDAESFQSYQDLYAAVVKQMRYFIPLVRQVSRTAWNVERGFPLPFASALTQDCIKRGKDITDGGSRYAAGNAASFVGVIDAANSLAAIDRLVFQEGKLTMEQLREALAADFEGCEEVHRRLVDAPKYGNDDDYVDSIARDLYNICWEEHQRLPDYLDRPTKPEAYSVTAHFALGRFTGALPSGRRARIPLTDATVSASPGTDKNGPTALVRSAAKVIDTAKFGGNHFNMRFHPLSLEGGQGARKFLSLIKTYFDLGGYHVQFNCVTSDVLKQAQLHPEDYRDLVVRVAGFSAFFIHLDRAVQDELIKRTELRFP